MRCLPSSTWMPRILAPPTSCTRRRALSCAALRQRGLCLWGAWQMPSQAPGCSPPALRSWGRPTWLVGSLADAKPGNGLLTACTAQLGKGLPLQTLFPGNASSSLAVAAQARVLTGMEGLQVAAVLEMRGEQEQCLSWLERLGALAPADVGVLTRSGAIRAAQVLLICKMMIIPQVETLKGYEGVFFL